MLVCMVGSFQHVPSKYQHTVAEQGTLVLWSYCGTNPFIDIGIEKIKFIARTKLKWGVYIELLVDNNSGVKVREARAGSISKFMGLIELEFIPLSSLCGFKL